MMKVTLSLTHNCNLSCKYCYSGRKFKKNMSLVTAQKIVDFAMNITPHEQRIEFCFFGGEPFLCFDLMKEIVSYIRKKERETGKLVSLNVTSNGTLISQSIIDFLKEGGVDLCISIDGTAHVHDLNRCYSDGGGCFQDVVRHLHEAIEQLNYVQVNAVYGPDTIDYLPETVSFFTPLGISTIHLNPNICAIWPEESYLKFRKIYAQIANYYIHSYQSGQECAINLIDSKIILFLKGGYEATDVCGMGETEWGFAPSGNIFPCERFIGEDDANSLFCLGNVHTGLDHERLSSLLKQRGNSNKECKTCVLCKYCMNWCGCTNFYMTGQTDLAGPVLCESEKAVIEAAKYVFITLKDNELFLDHFMKYLQDGHNR